MNNYFKHISPYVIAIAILVVALVFTQQCCRNGGSEVEVYIHDTTTTYVVHNNNIYRDTGKNIPYEVKVYVDVPVYVDCDSAARELYATTFTRDTVRDDSILTVIINDSISQNQTVYRDSECKVNQPTVIHQTTVTYDTCKQCKQFNIGFGGLIGGYTDKFGAGPSIMLTTNKKSSYSISYDAINKIGYFGIYWNIK
jgi:hypothetical protein